MYLDEVECFSMLIYTNLSLSPRISSELWLLTHLWHLHGKVELFTDTNLFKYKWNSKKYKTMHSKKQ